MFMQNEEICMRIKNIMKTLNNSKEDTKYNRIKLLIAYATALITYENCQRSGVVTNLTIEELEPSKGRQWHDCNILSEPQDWTSGNS